MKDENIKDKNKSHTFFQGIRFRRKNLLHPSSPQQDAGYSEKVRDEEVKYPQSIKEFLFELIKITLISLAIIIPVRYFLIQPFYVKGASMEPNFYDHEYLIIDEISYRFSGPQRGDIVVFKYPLDPSQYFIKRIIALPGEKIGVEKGEIKIYNEKYSEGRVLEESGYLFPGTKTSGKLEMSLGESDYFVLGDNRNSSLDSRSFGSVPKENIIGRAWLRGWPVDRIGHFITPLYNL